MRRRWKRTAASSASRYFDERSGEQGIVHVVGPEQGLTQPGMTICCGDSHTSTHGAFGAIAFGIGTTPGARRARARRRSRWRRSRCGASRSTASCGPGVYAKDVILHVIRTLGVQRRRRATPTSTPATPSTACRWKSA